MQRWTPAPKVMDTGPEGDVAVGLAGQIQALGVGEGGVFPVGGREEHEDSHSTPYRHA